MSKLTRYWFTTQGDCTDDLESNTEPIGAANEIGPYVSDSDAAALEAENERLKALLKKIEWRGGRWRDNDVVTSCPCCNAYQHAEYKETHNDGCELAAVIKIPV